MGIRKRKKCKITGEPRYRYDENGNRYLAKPNISEAFNALSSWPPKKDKPKKKKRHQAKKTLSTREIREIEKGWRERYKDHPTLAGRTAKGRPIWRNKKDDIEYYNCEAVYDHSKAYESRNRILKQMGFDNYQAYLKSNLWRLIRFRVYEVKDTCVLCSVPAELVHHSRYDRATLEGDSLEHLHPMCNKCHESIEFTSKGQKRDFATVDRQFQALLKLKNDSLKTQAV